MWRRRVFLNNRANGRNSSTKNDTVNLQQNANTNPYQYCVDLVRQRDRENYLCSLLLPTENHLAAFAVRAFNVELAGVRSMVSGQQTASMRFQFWSSAVDKIFDRTSTVPEHPVVLALAKCAHEKKLSKKWLRDLIDARVERVDARKSFQTIKEAEDYYQRTVGGVLFLLLESCDVRDVHADHAASHLAKALGLINGLRAVCANVERNMNLLPMELLVHHRVSQQEIFRLSAGKLRRREMGGEGEALENKTRNVVYDLASQAHVHLEHARKFRSSEKSKERVDKRIYDSARSVLLPAAIADHYLNVLRRVDFDLFHPEVCAPYAFLPWTLWWRKLTRRF